MAPWRQQEPGKGSTEPPSAKTALAVGVMSVTFSAVLSGSAIPAGEWAQIPLLLPQGATSTLKHRAGPGS